MSNGNPLGGNGGGNGNPLLLSVQQLAPGNPFADAATPPNPMDHRNVTSAHVSLALHGLDQETLIRKRDQAGGEMEKLVELMNDPNPQRQEVVDYIHTLTADGQVSPQEATAMVHSLPADKDGIHDWAKMMFSAVMHVGIHAHAAYPQELFPGPSATGGTESAADGTTPPLENQEPQQ